MTLRTALRSTLALALGCAFALPGLGSLGCSSVYYDLNESILGRHKRDILNSRVEAARDEEQEAQEQILSTFELFKQATGFQGGDLETYYNRLQGEYDDSTAKAEAVSRRIDSIEDVAGDLFREWESEIDLISNPDLRRRSAASLGETRIRYGELIGAMRRAEARMEPVLLAFRDQVLYLKHNLNARAVASLENNVVAIEDDVAALVREMQAAIREADRFVSSMGG